METLIGLLLAGVAVFVLLKRRPNKFQEENAEHKVKDALLEAEIDESNVELDAIEKKIQALEQSIKKAQDPSQIEDYWNKKK